MIIDNLPDSKKLYFLCLIVSLSNSSEQQAEAPLIACLSSNWHGYDQ